MFLPSCLFVYAMKNIKLPGTFFLLAISVSGTDLLAEQTTIEGQWQCLVSYQGYTTGSGIVSFDKSGQCLMGGQPFSYELLADNTLQISKGNVSDTYTYHLEKDRLKLSYRDGSGFDCEKQSASSVPGGLLKMDDKSQPQTGGNEWQLQGVFCHYSGSSSYSSSYSSTSRITFDGQGRWSMGSESSFSGDAGSAYSGGGVDNRGTYSVNGGQIMYTTNSGEQGVLRVNMQQSDGHITEIYLGEDLYSPSLCN